MSLTSSKYLDSFLIRHQDNKKVWIWQSDIYFMLD
jgi:hypothetical protein